MKKFELVKERKKKIIIFGGTLTLYRIRALKDFSDVKKGDLGGFVEFEENLSQAGNCWIYDDAEVSGLSKVCDNETLRDSVKLLDGVTIYGDTQLRGDLTYTRENMYDILDLDTSVGKCTKTSDFSNSTKEFLKFDSNKPKASIAPIKGYEEVLKVAMFGAKKYETLNWKKCKQKYRYADAAIRHILFGYLCGEELDPESKLHHLAHAGFCILAELELFGEKNSDNEEV